MNSFTHLRLSKHKNRIAFFYDLYCSGQEDSERGSFTADYGEHDEYPFVEAIMERLERKVLDKIDLTQQGFFRPEGKLVAIPGYGDNDGIVFGGDLGLRLFCYVPNNKTLIYLNGYHKEGVSGDYNKHKNFAHKAPRINAAVNAILKAETHGYLHLSPNGGYYGDHRFTQLLETDRDLELTNYL